jgi:hypothetical protein
VIFFYLLELFYQKLSSPSLPKKMASVRHQNFESNFSHFSHVHSLKLATKLLAPVCFFSVIFSYSSLLPFISNFMQFPSFNIDKNYVFLLCNGILVLIVKNSVLKISDSHLDSSANLYGEQNKKSGYSPHKLVEVSEITKPALVAEEKVVVEVEEVREDEQGGHGIIVVDEDEEEEEEEVIGLLSTEELNKKCDDFIRKMKDDIKFEAQQLIMVRY